MKKRTFFLTLALFLLFFYGGMLLISAVNLRTSLNSVRQRSLSEHYFLTYSLSRDLSAITGRGGGEREIEDLFGSFLSYYGKKDTLLELQRDGEPLYGSMPEGAPNPPQPRAGTREVRTDWLGDRAYMAVSGALPEPYGAYTLVYRYALADVLDQWAETNRTLFLVGAVCSSLLALSLLFLLGRVFRPLQQISRASQGIAQGDYGGRIPEKGKDELAGLARNFNHMAREIERQMDELAQTAAQKQRFVDNLAHEMRTPLTSIYGYAEYMQRAKITEEDKQFATSYIMSECRRLQSISSSLLDLATIREGELDWDAVSVPELLRSAQEALWPKAREKGVYLMLDCQADTICGDRVLLESLLRNLVENGLKACQPQGVVALCARSEPGQVVLQVKDNGKGMAPEELAHITQAFYRVDRARSRAEGGAGLGLALCQEIAVRHGATLEFFSQPGQGTTAKVTFTTP